MRLSFFMPMDPPTTTYQEHKIGVRHGKPYTYEPETVKAFVNAMQQAVYAVHYNPEAAAAIMATDYPNIEVTWKAAVYIQEGRNYQMFGEPGSETEAEILKCPGKMSEEGWKLNIEAAIATGTITEEIPLEDIYTNEFIDENIDYSTVEAFMDSIDVESVAANYEAE